MQDDLLVSVTNLSRFYGRRCAVKNLSFELRRGEVLGFLGPNGAGKSTTMQMLSGNLAPSEGQVLINGIDILDKPRLAKAKIGYLPEHPPLYKDMSVDEYLHFCAKLHRLDRHNQQKAIDSCKQRCDLNEVGKRLIGNLSKGFQQRVGIAQAIIHSPDVVILDEPTIGLDPNQIRGIRGLIRELGNQHSVILSTHILPEIQTTCDRVQIIHHGELVLSDDVADLERSMTVSSLLLKLANPPELSVLEKITSIESVELLNKNQYRIHYAAEQDPTDILVQLAVEHKWGLRELQPERRSLEDVFAHITTREPTEANNTDSSDKNDTTQAA